MTILALIDRALGLLALAVQVGADKAWSQPQRTIPGAARFYAAGDGSTTDSQEGEWTNAA